MSVCLCVGILYSEFLSVSDYEKVKKYAEVREGREGGRKGGRGKEGGRKGGRGKERRRHQMLQTICLCVQIVLYQLKIVTIIQY